MVGLHRRNRDATDDRVHVSPWPNRFSLQPIFNDRERWVREDLAIREHAEERDLVAGKAAFKESRQLRLHLEIDLVDDRAGDLDATGGEECGVQHDLVDRSPDPPLAHDHDRRPQECGNIGV